LKDVKELKTERNELTEKVQVSKQDREEIKKKMPQLQARIDELHKQREALSQKLGFTKNIGFLKKEIEALGDRLVTTPMSFQAEKKLMKEVNDKKKLLGSAGEISKISSEMKKLIQERDMYRKIFDVSNTQVKSTASKSQQKHASMLTGVQKLDDLRNNEKEAFLKFKELKDKYQIKSSELNEKVEKLKSLQDKVGIAKAEIKQKHEANTKRTLADMRKEIEEKMMRGEKLNTDDLLILQSE
jgi:uncharacterized coiled-coil DUF342 family protein